MVDWILVGQTTGSGETQVLVRAYENLSSARTTSLVVSGNTQSVTIPITQSAYTGTLHVSQTYFDVPSSGGTYSFTVSSSSAWNTSGNTYVSLSPSSGSAGVTTVTFTLGTNTGSTWTETFGVYNANDEVSVTVKQKTLDYLRFEIVSDGYIQVHQTYAPIYYSKNGGSWTTVASGTSTVNINVVNGDELLFKSTAIYPGGYNRKCNYSFAYSTAGFNLYGNIMSMIDADNFETLDYFPVSSATFENGFRGCSKLYNASGMTMPATGLSSEYCYATMFYNDSQLLSAPELPALYGQTACYRLMFYGCSNLNRIVCMLTYRSSANDTYNWVTSVAPSGTFVKASGSTWSTGTSGIPSGWTVEEV